MYRRHSSYPYWSAAAVLEAFGPLVPAHQKIMKASAGTVAIDEFFGLPSLGTDLETFGRALRCS